MSTRVEHSQPDISKPSEVATYDTRFDAAHTINGQDLPSAPVAEDEQGDSAECSVLTDDAAAAFLLSAGEPSEADLAVEQLKRQAGQLADYLRERQNQIDHREAQINAEVAMMQSEVRAARLWLSEREAEMAERAKALENREKECLERLERLAAAESALMRQTVAQERTDDLSARLAAENERFTRLAEELNETRRQWEARQQQAENALQHERRQFEVRQAAWERLVRQRESQLEEKRRNLEARGRHVERARNSLLRLRADVRHAHQQALEMRLAAEALWTELSSAAPPAALTHGLGRIRKQLADQYRLENAELQSQRKELEAIRGELSEQLEKLLEKKRQFDAWSRLKQGELQQQASMLIAQEQALQAQQSNCDDQMRLWQAQRIEYEREISGLRLKLAAQGHQTVAAAKEGA